MLSKDQKESLAKLKNLVEEVKICMLTFVENDSKINSRPMSTARFEDNGNIWFYSKDFSGATQAVNQTNTVNLIYAHPGKNTYVNVEGTITIVHDEAKIKELWSPLLQAWFPQGFDEPGLCLLKVSINEAHYWDSSSSSMVVLFNMLKAILTDEVYKEGEHGSINL